MRERSFRQARRAGGVWRCSPREQTGLTNKTLAYIFPKCYVTTGTVNVGRIGVDINTTGYATRSISASTPSQESKTCTRAGTNKQVDNPTSKHAARTGRLTSGSKCWQFDSLTVVASDRQEVSSLKEWGNGKNWAWRGGSGKDDAMFKNEKCVIKRIESVDVTTGSHATTYRSFARFLEERPR